MSDEKLSPQEALGSYDTTFLQCRDMRHAWEEVGYYREGGYVRRLLTCLRCGMDRTDKWGANGRREQPTYTQPDGYSLAGIVEDGVRADDVRSEKLRRANVYASHQTMLQALKKRGNRRKGPLRAVAEAG